MAKNDRELTATVIPIPDDSTAVAEPRIFRPVNALKTKFYLYAILAFLGITAAKIAFLAFLLVVAREDSNFQSIVLDNLLLWALVYLGVAVLIFGSILMLIPPYVNSMSYQVHGSEIVVFKGLINKTEKHVPFRTVTNISSRAGPLDRFLGIGNVFIETAGQSGHMAGPEERIEGVRVYKEVRDFILKELRKFRAPYATTTEFEGSSGLSAENSPIVKELREIKDILRKMSEN
jgi:membrane protein YdbS with pleckstrin-like domain